MRRNAGGTWARDSGLAPERGSDCRAKDPGVGGDVIRAGDADDCTLSEAWASHKNGQYVHFVLWLSHHERTANEPGERNRV